MWIERKFNFLATTPEYKWNPNTLDHIDILVFGTPNRTSIHVSIYRQQHLSDGFMIKTALPSESTTIDFHNPFPVEVTKENLEQVYADHIDMVRKLVKDFHHIEIL